MDTRLLLLLLTLATACREAPPRLTPGQFEALQPPGTVESPACEEGAECDDGDLCTEGDLCAAGVCVGVPRSCDDSVACTADECDAALGCAHSPSDTACDDGVACSADLCDPQAGCTHEPQDALCLDETACTDDACDAAEGCVHSPRSGACDDGDACTTVDACSGGACTPGDPVDCSDGDACTTEACDKASGCLAASLVSCDDGDPCTSDSCDPASGCQSVAVAGCAPPLEGWAAAERVTLFEPQHDEGGPVLDGTSPQNEGGASSWQRLNELVEVPLTGGLFDDVVAYLPLDGSLEGELAGGFVAYDGGAVYEEGRFGGGARPVGAITVDGPAGAGSFTLALWALMPTDGASPIDVMGFYPPPPSAPFHIRIVSGTWRVASGALPGVVLGPVKPVWQHIAVLWDANAQEGRAHLDGVMVAAVGNPGGLANALMVLGSPSGGTKPTALVVDELLYLRRALDPVEAAGLARAARPFAAPLVPAVAQRDWDDVRVTRIGHDGAQAPVVHDVIGRRPHGDSGPEAQDVAVCWPLDGDLTPSVGDAVSELGDATSERGAFGDEGGALRFTSAGTRLWTNREGALTTPLSVELWVKTTAKTPCSKQDDGGVLLQTAISPLSDPAGFVLRLCDGHVRFSRLDGAQEDVIEGSREVTDGRWHHLLVSVGDPAWAIYVDGAEDAASSAKIGAFSDGLHPITPLYVPGPDIVTDALVDDVCIHTVARGPGYAYRRVWPPVPTIRFLASTEGEGPPFALPDYAIHVGNPTAAAAPGGDGCDDVLSCIGVVSLWRFDRRIGDGGLVLPDEAVSGRQAVLDVLDGLVAPAPAGDGAAVALFGSSAVSPVGLPALSSWTMEALVRPSPSTTKAPIVFAGDAAEGPWLAMDGLVVSHGFSGASVALTGATVPPTLWTAIGGSFGEGVLSVLQGGLEESVEAAATPPGSTQMLHLFAAPDGEDTFSGAVDTVRITDRPLSFAERIKPVGLSWRAD